jgi:hypothetical protein
MHPCGDSRSGATLDAFCSCGHAYLAHDVNMVCVLCDIMDVMLHGNSYELRVGNKRTRVDPMGVEFIPDASRGSQAPGPSTARTRRHDPPA